MHSTFCSLVNLLWHECIKIERCALLTVLRMLTIGCQYKCGRHHQEYLIRLHVIIQMRILNQSTKRCWISYQENRHQPPMKYFVCGMATSPSGLSFRLITTRTVKKRTHCIRIQFSESIRLSKRFMVISFSPVRCILSFDSNIESTDMVRDALLVRHRRMFRLRRFCTYSFCLSMMFTILR